MHNQIDLNRYSKFVEQVTSKESNNLTDFVDRIHELVANSQANKTPVNVPLLLTAAIGLAAEGGEFAEIPKKLVFQGKPITDEELFHMKRELGDIFFYWTNACRALNLDPNSVIQENINKLSKRYPNGFSVERSENREVGDI